MLEMLIVDDEETTVNFLKEFFEKEGFRVRIAYSGKVAVEEIEKKDADLILLDVQMPGMDGIEVLKRIKQKKSMAKVLMVTGENDPETIEKTLQCGADYYILKPFMLQELTKQVRKMAEEVLR